MRGPSKIYEVELAANAFQIDLVSNDFDSYLRVLDKNGKELAFDDDSGGGRNARLTFTPPSPGVYRIVAASFNGNVGDFTLSIEKQVSDSHEPGDSACGPMSLGSVRLRL